MTPEERIRDLARKSAIDAAEAERLLAAIGPAKGRARTWDPFERVDPMTAVLLGIAAAVGMIAMARLHIRTPGLIDLRATDGPVRLTSALLDQLVAFPLPALVLWGIGRGFARKVRLLDMAAAVALTRVAATVLACPLALLARLRGGSGTEMTPLTVVITIFALVCVTAEITLLVLGFRNATALRGVRLTIAAIVALFVAELTSTVVRALLPG